MGMIKLRVIYSQVKIFRPGHFINTVYRNIWCGAPRSRASLVGTESSVSNIFAMLGDGAVGI